jgi:hypothetical protein
MKSWRENPNLFLTLKQQKSLKIDEVSELFRMEDGAQDKF